MASTLVKARLQARSWRKDQFLISTNPTFFPISTLIDIFSREEFYWAKPLPAQEMREILDNSLSFGLYDQQDHQNQASPTSEPALIGIARCVTDYVTFAYITDVWVDPTYQGKGLGKWLVTCVQEVLEEMPHLRRTLLFTGDWERSVPFYEKLMGVKLLETKRNEGLAIMESKGKGHPSYGSPGTGYN